MENAIRVLTLFLALMLIGGCANESTPSTSMLEGEWLGSAINDSGSTPLKATFIQTGTALSGEVVIVAANNPSGALSGSKMDSMVRFTVEIDFEFATAKYDFVGELEDGNISGTFNVDSEEAGQGEGTFTLAKQ